LLLQFCHFSLHILRLGLAVGELGGELVDFLVHNL
jgi:hypothetical protein